VPIDALFSQGQNAFHPQSDKHRVGTLTSAGAPWRGGATLNLAIGAWPEREKRGGSPRNRTLHTLVVKGEANE
jgi:hypothetical protein